VQTDERLPIFKSEVKKEASEQSKLSAPKKQGSNHIYLLRLCFDPEDRGSTFLRNFRLKRRYIPEENDFHFLDSFLS
jgi:hypothetical protein